MCNLNVCPICKNTNLLRLPNYNKSYLVKCSNCGFVFSNQLPPEIQVKSIYDAYGRNDYLSEITIKRYNELLDSFEKYRKTNNLLDVGCGVGYFLDIAKKRGWNVYGTEFSENAVSICAEKGIKMFLGILTVDSFPQIQFDVVTAFEVVEHVSFPNDIISNMNYYLEKGGVIYLTTPNFNSLLRRYLKSKWDVIAYPEHLSYFTKSSLNSMMKQFGYKNIYLKTHGLSVSRLKKAKTGVKEKYISASSTDEKIRVSLEQNKLKLFIKKIINYSLTVFALGDSLKALYIKK